jgi:hypothetical protein
MRPGEAGSTAFWNGALRSEKRDANPFQSVLHCGWYPLAWMIFAQTSR